jgi:hypothetical protein
LEEANFDKFSGEAAQESTFLWRDFFIGSKKKESATFQWREQQRERAHLSLGTSFSGSCGKACEEIALYTGSFVLYYFLYLML